MLRAGLWRWLRAPAAEPSDGVRRWTLACTGLMMLLALVACGNLAGCSSGGSGESSVASSEEEGEPSEEEYEEEYGPEEPEDEGESAASSEDEEADEGYDEESDEEADYDEEAMDEEEDMEEEEYEEDYEEEEMGEEEEEEEYAEEEEEMEEEEPEEEEEMEESEEGEEEYEGGEEGEEGYGRGGGGKPNFPEGSPQAVIYNLVLQIRGDLDQAELVKLISAEAKGDLALLRSGQVPDEKKTALKTLVERLRFVGKPRVLGGGKVQLSLQNVNTGQILRFTCVRENERYVVQSLNVIEPPRRRGSLGGRRGRRR